MSWWDVIEVGLGAANLAANASNAQKLEQMRRQGAAVALMEAIVKELRNQIFKYKQTAEEILAMEAKSPKIAAAAMRLLELRFDDSGITPDLFNELGDKDYVANVMRTIRENSGRLMEKLMVEERVDVNAVIDKVKRLPDYAYYLDHHEKVHAYQEALSQPHEMGSGLQLLGVLTIFGGGFLGVVTSCFGYMAGGYRNDPGAVGVSCLGQVLVLLAVGAGIALLVIGGTRSATNQKIKRIQEEVDIARYDKLAIKFGIHSLDEVRQEDRKSVV